MMPGREDGCTMKPYRIITIEREFGSGGSPIGESTAKALGVPCYGKEILEMAAREGNTTTEYIAHLEETTTGSLLYSMVAAGKAMLGEGNGLAMSQSLFLLEAKIIQRLAEQGPCVLVGRCAGWVLRERKDVLSVFIHGDDESRMRRITESYGISPQKASPTLRAYDRRRSNFYHATTGMNWKEKAGYHLVLDSGLLGEPLCAAILQHTVGNSKTIG